MSLHPETNMADVPEQGELVPVGDYLVRVSSVKEDISRTSKMPIVNFEMKIQDEGPNLGRPLYITASLQSHALFMLKAIYTAAGYKPGPEGHDPEQVLDSSFYVHVEHKDGEKGTEYEGQKFHDIKPQFVRSLDKGPYKARR